MTFSYCLRCKTKTNSINESKYTINNRTMIKSICVKCNSKKSMFIKR